MPWSPVSSLAPCHYPVQYLLEPAMSHIDRGHPMITEFAGTLEKINPERYKELRTLAISQLKSTGIDTILGERQRRCL